MKKQLLLCIPTVLALSCSDYPLSDNWDKLISAYNYLSGNIRIKITKQLLEKN
ncbi:MAG: hypothetical protein LUF85_02305 [Bacteroides sp.]|nr:hypothetical protein [Bacteroides sp.]